MHVGFAFAGVPKILDLEPVFNAMGDDWIRYSNTNWIMWTEKNAATLYRTLESHLDTFDNVFIAPFDATGAFGRLQPWMWDWMRLRQDVIQQLYLAPPLPPSTFGS
jgi:hypothetical protein